MADAGGIQRVSAAMASAFAKNLMKKMSSRRL